MWAALLAAPPNADGYAYEELVALGYARQRVSITSCNANFDANIEPVAFGLSEGVVVKHIGLFDADGLLRFYGFLSGHCTSQEMPSRFEFGSFDLKLKKSPASGVCERRS
jgi:hypothetical protein